MENIPQAAHHPVDSALVAAIAVAAFVICGLLFRSWVSSRNDGGKASFVAALIAVAALPAWGSFLYIFFGSFQSNSTEYWAAAPWLMIYATFLYSGYAISGAAIIGAIYFAAPGSRTRRLNFAIVALIAVAIGAWMMIHERIAKSEQAKLDEQADKRAVSAFVEHDASVLARLPEGTQSSLVTATVGSYRSQRAQLPFQYFLFVRPRPAESHTLEVVVNVTRTMDGPEFRVACFVGENEDWMKSPQCQPAKSTTRRQD
jgi:hypothetical protein